MRKVYLLRLDDACEKMDIDKWNRMESILDKHGVLPLVGVIPHCEDKKMEQYEYDSSFWNKVDRWIEKGWSIAMHGYNHVYSTKCGGINPVNKQSEFAGEPLAIQKEKIKKGIEIFNSHGIKPKIFFAPSHTFDKNTLVALKEESDIRIISDTIAKDVYQRWGFIFIPQQSGRVRKLPFKTITYCYHPNVMDDNDFIELDSFLSQHNFSQFVFSVCKRKKSLYDHFLSFVYMLMHKA